MKQEGCFLIFDIFFYDFFMIFYFAVLVVALAACSSVVW